MEKVYSDGQMGESTRVTGKEMKCTVRAHLLGLTAVNTEVSIRKTLNMATEYLSTLTAVSTSETGKKVSKMVMAFTSVPMEHSTRVFGKMDF